MRYSLPCSNALGCVSRRLVCTSFLGSTASPRLVALVAQPPLPGTGWAPRTGRGWLLGALPAPRPAGRAKSAQARRRSHLFNAAWCVWTPQPRGTKLQLRCSVVGLLRGPLAPRLSGSRGSAARPPVRFLPSPRLGLAFWLPQSRMPAAVLGPCESLGGERG